MAYSIGARSFDDLKGAINLPTRMHDVESRTGQDGVVVFSTGKRGVPFILESLYVETTYLLAQTLANAYQLDPSLTPVNIVRGTVDFTATSFRFVVIGVEVQNIEPVISWVGARGSASPAFKVRAAWRIQAIEI
jgi:hypothetical protein